MKTEAGPGQQRVGTVGHHNARKRFKISRYDLHDTTCRCFSIVVLPSVTLWRPSLNPVVGRFGIENKFSQARLHYVSLMIHGWVP